MREQIDVNNNNNNNNDNNDNNNNNNNNSNNRQKYESDEDKNDKSKTVKKFDGILKDIKNNGRHTKPVNSKTRGSNINLYPLTIKLVNAEKIVLKNDSGFDEVFNIFL